MTATALVTAAAVAGAAAGPWLRARIFSNSVAYRRPLRRRCPRCRQPLATSVWAMMPVTGRCPRCARRIGPATAAVEATAALVAALIAWRSHDLATFTVATWVAAFGIVLSFVDATVRRLPDRITLPAITGTVTILAVTAAATTTYHHLLTALASAALLGGTYLAMVLARPTAIGLGDAKLAALTGLLLGSFSLSTAFAGLIAATLIGTATGLVLLATRRIHLRQGFAHGPAMMLGALLAFTLASLPQ
ncbi:leader peptidase (prepilin peptidase)/N-methyltransferase [Micromonospora sp. Llam0]|uniref:prepilin peptidase n=1 Tax=Micromonospora sp. Llam0 TaxID=2485143 RepID=UPI000F4AA1FD|nr:prepilin peptidase [Micromonospora sp. Llam0]ROO52730.1 leader peptidase (prepilin peptidase)/N-methyltransferase [Micromonospora sp. Llam0]